VLNIQLIYSVLSCQSICTRMVQIFDFQKLTKSLSATLAQQLKM